EVAPGKLASSGAEAIASKSALHGNVLTESGTLFASTWHSPSVSVTAPLPPLPFGLDEPASLLHAERHEKMARKLALRRRCRTLPSLSFTESEQNSRCRRSRRRHRRSRYCWH